MNAISSIKHPVSTWLDDKNTLAKLASILLGVGLLSALAQIAIPLPFTPVPITGQTFGVALLSLMLGRQLGFTTVATYVLLGTLGLPIFSGAQAGLRIAGAGYLVGMCLASIVIGSLADRGWSKNFASAFAASLIGSICVFTCGLIILAQFVPSANLFQAGLLPFIPGDLIKSALAAGIVSKVFK
jgi:biotin transport system substrate-specific component